MLLLCFTQLRTAVERKLVTISNEDDSEERIVQECNEWVVQQGLPSGELLYQLAAPETGELLAVFDLAWSKGIQEGYSQPVALLIDESPEVEELANRTGYRYFTNLEVFKLYVQREILAIENQSLAIAS